MVAVADKDVCIRCGGCVAVCPKAAITLTEHGIVVDADRCIDCNICVNFCPVHALRLEKGVKA